MSSRIQSDLLLVDGALRSIPSRALLKGGSVDAWAACNVSLRAVLPILRQSALADRSCSASAAVSMHWRKSNASKKLLALLRAVVEEAPALQGEAAHATPARTITCGTLRVSIGMLDFFWQRTQQSATLWPAMREWIVELGGVTSLWTALAWVVMIPKRDADDDAFAFRQLLRVSVHSVLDLTHDVFGIRQPVELAQSTAVVTVLSSVLGDLLPRDFAAGNAQAWDLHVVFYAVNKLDQLEGSMLAAQLHKPLLRFWPYLIAELQQQRRLHPDVAEASDASRDWLCGLKVHCLTLCIALPNPPCFTLFHIACHYFCHVRSCNAEYHTALLDHQMPTNS